MENLPFFSCEKIKMHFSHEKTAGNIMRNLRNPFFA